MSVNRRGGGGGGRGGVNEGRRRWGEGVRWSGEWEGGGRGEREG